MRYHFISRKEIKLMMVLVNVFAILSAALFSFIRFLPGIPAQLFFSGSC